jgi:hypothetical protein
VIALRHDDAVSRLRVGNRRFHHQQSSRQLRDEQSLAEAGVNAGDTLRLVPEITAGSR